MLEALVRAMIFHLSPAVLILDDDRICLEASVGAGKLLGLTRDKIIGRSLDELAASGTATVFSERWQGFLKDGQQTGTLALLSPDGTKRDFEYILKASLLPARHLLILNQSSAKLNGMSSNGAKSLSGTGAHLRAQDYGLFLLHVDGEIAAWYPGAERIYGYARAEAEGQHVSMLYADKSTSGGNRNEPWKRSIGEGPFGEESWQVKKDGGQFWANVITVALKDENGELEGFAVVTRDFSGRHELESKIQARRARLRLLITEETIAGIVSCEFDRIPEANDAFLELLGYSREDLFTTGLRWPDLTPPEFHSLDEIAHEERLRLGTSTPYEKELIRKDGTRVRVLVSSALVRLSPFQWITFVQNPQVMDQVDESLEEVTEATNQFEGIVGKSAPVRRMLGQVEVVAPTGTTVLIQGETGTGKELIARAIHEASPRKAYPFVVLNCAAIPSGLLESELFGHERGAFTGALTQKIGRFEMANRGTIFLDEVGDMPLDLQPKLLRALQEKSIERLGGNKTIPIDVRLIAATNRNLTEMMEKKEFRSDLYYRLRVFPITTPPLRERVADIPILVRHFTKRYAERMGRQIDTIPPETMDALMNWSWPGNIRELENFIERCVVLSPGPSLYAPLAELRTEEPEVTGRSALEQMEREYLLRVLRESGGVVSAAANRLGIPRTTLNAMMKRLEITRSEF